MDTDIEKTMRFILDMQAKHEANLQRLEESAKEHHEAMREHAAAIKKHDEAIIRIEAAVEANATRIGQLVDVSLSLAHSMEQSAKKLREEIREAQTATNDKLNALIDTVDKIVRKNGRSRKKS
jgi:methyl-accepting chemotaxis protein